VSRTTTSRAPAPYRLRLYIAGGAPNSTLAQKNMLAICRQHLNGKHRLEIIDVLKEPERALEDGILVTPTLLKLSPDPVVTMVGDLSATDAVLQSLGLAV
jgi:circadian clock protein KaiB